MRKKLKLGKLLAVIFLTVLIWVWADLRQDEEYPLEGARINAAKPADSWVRLNGGDSVIIDEVVFSGPLSNINDLKAREAAGTFQPTFVYDPRGKGPLPAASASSMSPISLPPSRKSRTLVFP